MGRHRGFLESLCRGDVFSNDIQKDLLAHDNYAHVSPDLLVLCPISDFFVRVPNVVFDIVLLFGAFCFVDEPSTFAQVLSARMSKGGLVFYKDNVL